MRCLCCVGVRCVGWFVLLQFVVCSCWFELAWCGVFVLLRYVLILLCWAVACLFVLCCRCV